MLHNIKEISYKQQSMNSEEAKTWYWRGFPIQYQVSGESGPAVILVHGFGACWQHWRKNLPFLGQNCRCYAVDLIGFGKSAKPKPQAEIEYTFETWAAEIIDFAKEIVGEEVFLVGNSIGAIVVLQAAVTSPELCRGIVILNCSLRLLHESKRSSLPWYRQIGTDLLQQVLGNRTIGYFFFAQLAKPKVIRNILEQAYHREEAVTDELVDLLYQPALEEGAADVFLAFTRYSSGPIAETLLPLLTCPTVIFWGDKDPWEPIELGRELGNYSTVEDFIPLEGVGHCPQDEAPDLVNPLLLNWILAH